MISSTVMLSLPTAVDVSVSDDALTVELSDGRSVSAPLAWYPRLSHANKKERKNWRLIGEGQGVHWPDLDEDISVANILAGQASGESQASFKRWLQRRNAGSRARS